MARGQKTKVLLASACRAQREEWRSAITLYEGLEVAADAAEQSRLLSLLATSPIEILLLDVKLGAIDVLEEMHAKSPDTRILIVGDMLGEEYVSRALLLGVRGFLNGCDPMDYVKAIRVVAAGDLWVARSTLGRLLQEVLPRPTPSHRPRWLPHRDRRSRHAPRPSDPLTTREREIVVCITQGMTNKEIGKRLGVSDRTIKVHLGHVFKKLKISRRIQLLLERAASE